MPMIVLVVLVLSFVVTVIVVKKKNLDLWISSYLKEQFRSSPKLVGPVHILFCYVDHYEPMWLSPGLEIERRRVDRWLKEYPELCKNHRDADGRYPQHTFFYPQEEYKEEHLWKIEQLCRGGYGEIEIHLHHEDDTSENLTETLIDFKELLHEKHGALSIYPETQEIAYAFIHGNWCLDNSRKDGSYCGVNDEILVLKNTGCYADFTLPSAPDESQTKTINSIYYAKDNPLKPKSHDTGIKLSVGGNTWGDMIIIQGPLGLSWKKSKLGFMPKIENGDIKKTNPPSNARVDFWVDRHIHVKGRPEWVFVKVHTHGAQDRDMDTLLGRETDEMFSYLESTYNDGKNFVLHYVTAREMYNLAKAAEGACEGNPNDFRDYHLPPPGAFKR